MPEVEVLKLEYDADQAIANAARLREQIAQVQSQIAGLTDAMARDALSAGIYQKQIAELNGELGRLQAAERQATAAVVDHASVTVQASTATRKLAAEGEAGFQRLSGGIGGAQAKLQSFAYLLDDLQYVGQSGMGLRPLLNNLAQVSPHLFLAGLAIDQLIRHWDELEKAVEDTPFESQLYPLKAVGQAFHWVGEQLGFVKTEAEQAKAALDEAAKGAAERLAKIQSPRQKERSEGLRKTIEEAGGSDQVIDDIIASRKRRGTKFTKEGEEEQRKRLQIDLDKALGGDDKAFNKVIEQAGPNSTFAQSIETNSPAFQRKVREQQEESRKAQERADAANQEYADTIEERAKALSQGTIGAELLQEKTPRTADVQAALARSGIEDVSDQQALDIQARAKELVDQQVADRALEKGISPEDARRQLRDERYEKAGAELTQANERRSREAIEKAEERDPLLRQKAELAARIGFAQGGAQGARFSVIDLLQAQAGVSAFDADPLARQLAGGQLQQAFARQLQGEAPRSSQVIDSSRLNDAIQSGVGGTGDAEERIARDAAQQLQVMQQLLEIERRRDGFGGGGAVFGMLLAGLTLLLMF
jgi:hypothetical protein